MDGEEMTMDGEEMVCPGCGAMVRRPERDGLRSVCLSDVLPAVVPVVRYSRHDKVIEIFGGDSGYPEADPYWIDRRELTTLDAILRKVAHVGAKRWGHAPAFLHALGGAIVEAVMDEGGTPS